MSRPYNMYQPLPADFAARLDAEYDSYEVNGLIAAARRKGWTLRAIAEACRVTAEAVRLRSKKAAEMYIVACMDQVPDPVPKPVPDAPEISMRFRDIPASSAATLKALNDTARRVNGGTAADDPRRDAARAAAKLMYELHEEGYTWNALARAVGVTPTAVHTKVRRHGYLDMFPSQVGQEYQGRGTWQ